MRRACCLALRFLTKPPLCLLSSKAGPHRGARGQARKQHLSCWAVAASLQSLPPSAPSGDRTRVTSYFSATLTLKDGIGIDSVSPWPARLLAQSQASKGPPEIPEANGRHKRERDNWFGRPRQLRGCKLVWKKAAQSRGMGSSASFNSGPPS